MGDGPARLYVTAPRVRDYIGHGIVSLGFIKQIDIDCRYANSRVVTAGTRECRDC